MSSNTITANAVRGYELASGHVRSDRLAMAVRHGLFGKKALTAIRGAQT